MRLAVAFLIATAVFVIAVPAPSEAKTYIQLSPDSGPTASSVQVSGFGFASGEVRIALAPLYAEPTSGFLDSLPENEMVTLATVAVRNGGFERTVTLPGSQGFAWGKQVEILVIQADPPTSSAGFFVASATFSITALADLPAAGGGASAGDSTLGWLAVALLSSGLLAGCVGLGLRVLQRAHTR